MPSEVAVALIGVVVGGALAFLTQIIVDRKRIRREHITDTYAELCSVLADRALGRGAARDKARVQIAALSARIAIYGNDKVVKSLAGFINSETPTITDDPDGFAVVVEEMRKQAGAGTVDRDSIVPLIRGSRR